MATPLEYVMEKIELFANKIASISDFLNTQVFGINTYQIIASCVFILMALTLRKIIVKVILGAIEKKAKKTEAQWDEATIKAITPPLEVLIVTYGIWFAIRALPQPTEPVNVEKFVQVTGHTLVLIILAWGLLRLVGVASETLSRKAADPEHWLDLGIVPLINLVMRFLIVIISGIVIAQNLGYSVSGLVASLGLGGAALALASKDTLSNLFGSLMILMDKPFKVGDWIKSDNFEGVVEEVGFRSTRIRTFGKTIENIPNSVMANVKVENMDRRKDKGLNVRRIKMTIGLSYAANSTQLENVLEAIREILRTDEGVDKRMTSLVYFTDFGESALDIFIYYFADSANWAYYLGVRERVNLKIMKKLEEMNLALALPSRSIYIENIQPDVYNGISDRLMGNPNPQPNNDQNPI